MDEVLSLYYHQTLTLKYNDHLYNSELCLALMSLSELKKSAHLFLHRQEMMYFSTLKYPKRQLSYLLGHFVAKQAIASCTKHIALNEMLIEYGIFNFPLIVGAVNRLNVTYSHSSHYGIALTYPETCPIGIDLEQINVDKTIVIASQLTDEEKRLIQNLDEPQENLLTLVWTIKEALSKALRTGMMSPFEVYAIKTIKKGANQYLCEFKYFPQYLGISFSLGNFFVSIVYPIRADFTIDIPNIQNWIKLQEFFCDS